MKLLILTQKVDKNDDVLGFFHRWVEEFAKHCEKIIVICLEKGEYSLPENVKVFSLGKENPVTNHFLLITRIFYIFKFYTYIWRERKNYDAVFVHMNQEYAILGGVLWKALGKKVLLWRNHLKGSVFTKIAVSISNKVYCTSPASYTARFKKTKIMPAGIDTNFFMPDHSIQRKPDSVLFLGRIAPVKRVLEFVEALNTLREQGRGFIATIAGAALPKDEEYEKMIREKVAGYGLEDKVNFTGAVTQEEARNLYREHAVYVNLTPSGSLDKTILEAAACKAVPAVSNNALGPILGDERIIKDVRPESVANAIRKTLDESHGSSFRDAVIREHSLGNLVSKLCNEIIR